MKKLVFSTFILFLLGLLPATASTLNYSETPMDTITIQIGKTKKIIIWVDDKKDLEELQTYDLNKIISELSNTVDSLQHAEQILIITNDDGEQVSITIETRKEAPVEREEDSENEEEIAEEEESDEEWYKHDRDTTDDDRTINMGVHFNRKEKDHNHHFGTRHHLEFDLGMNNYIKDNGEFPGNDNEQYAVRPWGSWFVGINSNFRTHIAGPLALQWGGGVSWYNFKFEDARTRLEKTPEELLFIRETRTDIDAVKSKLTASYLNLNLVPMLDFRYKTRTKINEEGKRERVRYYKDKAFRIGLGGYAGYRIGSHTKYKYSDGNIEKDKDRDSFYLNNLRYGARLQVGFRGIDLFANYDLNNLFSTKKAPELHGVSFGITF